MCIRIKYVSRYPIAYGLEYPCFGYLPWTLRKRELHAPDCSFMHEGLEPKQGLIKVGL
jgi:hypothetical protein